MRPHRYSRTRRSGRNIDGYIWKLSSNIGTFGNFLRGQEGNFFDSKDHTVPGTEEARARLVTWYLPIARPLMHNFYSQIFDPLFCITWWKLFRVLGTCEWHSLKQRIVLGVIGDQWDEWYFQSCGKLEFRIEMNWVAVKSETCFGCHSRTHRSCLRDAANSSVLWSPCPCLGVICTNPSPFWAPYPTLFPWYTVRDSLLCILVAIIFPPYHTSRPLYDQLPESYSRVAELWNANVQ